MLKKKKMIVSLVIIVVLMVSLTSIAYAYTKSAIINGTSSYDYSDWIDNVKGEIRRTHTLTAFDSSWQSGYYLTDYVSYYNNAKYGAVKVYANDDFSTYYELGITKKDIRAYIENYWQKDVLCEHKIFWNSSNY